MSQSSLLDTFLKTKSSRTRKAYLQDFAHLASFLDMPSAETVLMVLLAKGPSYTLEQINKYQDFLEQRGLHCSTINRKLSAIRAIITYAQEVGRIDWELSLPNIRMSSKQERNQLPAVKRLISSVDRTTSKSYRDFAILRLIFDLALRRNEIVALNYPEHVDLKNGVLCLPNPRSKEPIFIELPQQTLQSLSEWIKIRGSKKGPLFINYDPARKGERLTGRSVDRNVIKPLTYLIGLHLSPERLRTFGIEQALKLVQEKSFVLEDVLTSVKNDAHSVQPSTSRKVARNVEKSG